MQVFVVCAYISTNVCIVYAVFGVSRDIFVSLVSRLECCVCIVVVFGVEAEMCVSSACRCVCAASKMSGVQWCVAFVGLRDVCHLRVVCGGEC